MEWSGRAAVQEGPPEAIEARGEGRANRGARAELVTPLLGGEGRSGLG